MSQSSTRRNLGCEPGASHRFPQPHPDSRSSWTGKDFESFRAEPPSPGAREGSTYPLDDFTPPALGPLGVLQHGKVFPTPAAYPKKILKRPPLPWASSSCTWAKGQSDRVVMNGHCEGSVIQFYAVTKAMFKAKARGHAFLQYSQLAFPVYFVEQAHVPPLSVILRAAAPEATRIPPPLGEMCGSRPTAEALRDRPDRFPLRTTACKRRSWSGLPLRGRIQWP